MKLIEKDRLADLLRSEAKLDALILNGVDNWEYYSESLCIDNGYNRRRSLSDEELTKDYKDA